jgi:hypothetical protein
MLCSEINVSYQQYDYAQDGLFCLLSLSNEAQHYILGQMNRELSLSATKENNQNYDWI